MLEEGVAIRHPDGAQLKGGNVVNASDELLVDLVMMGREGLQGYGV